MPRPAAVALLATSLCITAASAQTPEHGAPFASWARRHAVPLQADLHGIDSIIGSARVVALGEPAHGAHEPLAFRNQLFRYLVEHLGFTAIALESGFPESRRVADFVAGGPGEARAIVRDHLTWGFGSFAENVELVQWMRDYNANPAHRRKLRFYGIDVSLGGPGGSAPTPAAVEAALAFLARADSASARRLRVVVQPYLARLPVGALSFSRAAHDSLSAAIDDLIATITRERATLIAATSERDYAWGRHDAVVARQADQVFRVLPVDLPGGGIPPAAWRAVAARDSAMAENVRWVLSQEGSGGKLLVFAHNAHVKNAPTAGGVWRALARSPEAMGEYLRSSLGRQLIIIGAAAATDGEGLPPVTRDSAGIDAALARVGLSRFLLDLRAARDERDVAAWLARRRALRANFTTFLTLAPGTAFDALVYFDTLTAARTAPPAR